MMVQAADRPTVASGTKRRFIVELIKPSHYDDDGYVIQWAKSWIPSNSLACLYGLSLDAAQRRVLGDDVEIEIHAYDECNTVIPVKRIIRRFRDADNQGIVCLVGVQSNQYPRAMDLARQFRQAGIQVAIGGFHVSGCLSMLPELPADLQEALDLGVVLYAGEGEGRIEGLFADAARKELRSIYNYVKDLPDLQGAVVPFLPEPLVRSYIGSFASFDAGRGCPFQCSFCTIINVQGRKSRYRTADDVERIIRAGLAQGINRYFITDDNFARNKNWESIFDRLIELRRELDLGFMLQVDTLSHRIPSFIEKAALAGVSKVFIGLENVNPANLTAAKKKQNKITEYRRMLQAWRRANVITYAGYILGFPNDTPESIERDIRVIQKELSVDVLEFYYLTPLPGSEDHKHLYLKRVPMDPDLNKYDLEHVTTDHPRMSKEEWENIYQKAWRLYYSMEHIETLLRRAAATSTNPRKQTARVVYYAGQFYGTMVYEGVHPLQSGYFRRKVRTQRRSGMPRENPFVFYPRRLWETLRTYVPAAYFIWRLLRLRARVLRDPNLSGYTDLALQPAEDDDQQDLELLECAPVTPRPKNVPDLVTLSTAAHRPAPHRAA
jgi:radical SAM superfamily enzyme YgiQ (UPF0313 family)